MAVLCLFLVIACVFDYLQNRIPNRLLLLLFLTGVGWNGIWKNIPAMLFFFAGTVLVMLLMYPLFRLGCIGAGDVKLLGICAGYLPFGKILYFLFFSLLTAAIFSLIKLIKEHNVKERLYYLWAYLAEVLHSRQWRLYMDNEKERRAAGICLSGPILISVLMHIGGIY